MLQGSFRQIAGGGFSTIHQAYLEITLCSSMGSRLVSLWFNFHLTVHVTAAQFFFFFSLSLYLLSCHSRENFRGLLADQEAEWSGDETQIIYHKNNNKERYTTVKFAISERAFINSFWTKLGRAMLHL